MDAQLADIARYISMMALNSKEVKNKLAGLEKRGEIPGKSVHANIADDQDECCTPGEDQNGDNYEPPGEEECLWNFNHATEQYYNVCDDVEDCETGQPIDFTPQGFPEPERCKECAPDPEWEGGIFWFYTENKSIRGATPASIAGAALADRQESINNQDDFRNVELTQTSIDVGSSDAAVRYHAVGERYSSYWEKWDAWSSDGRATLRPSSCGDSTADYCTQNEPPIICGDDWESDGKTSLTIRNGCFVASKCDPDAQPSDLGCKECIELCKGGMKWTFCTTGDGGWVQYDPSGQKPGGKYDSNGKRTEIIQPGQEGMYL